MAIIIANRVIMVETVPAMASPPVEKMAPISGVMRVAPQVGQPAPRAIKPATMLALSRSAELCLFLLQRRTIRPIRMPCNTAMAKIGSQSKKGWPKPKIDKKLSQMIKRLSGRPRAAISLNLAVPLASRFINVPKKIKLGIKPYQKRFSLVASKIPLPAKTKSSSHFLQFIARIIAQIMYKYENYEYSSETIDYLDNYCYVLSRIFCSVF